MDAVYLWKRTFADIFMYKDWNIFLLVSAQSTVVMCVMSSVSAFLFIFLS